MVHFPELAQTTREGQRGEKDLLAFLMAEIARFLKRLNVAQADGELDLLAKCLALFLFLMAA